MTELTERQVAQALFAQNTLWIKTKSYTGVGRQCKTCTRERTRSPEYKAKARERARLKRQRTRLLVPPGSQRSDQP